MHNYENCNCSEDEQYKFIAVWYIWKWNTVEDMAYKWEGIVVVMQKNW
jgi:hypothetical protein